MGGERKEEHFRQFFEFCHCSLCYDFTNFKLLVFLDHLKYGHLPNRGYFKSSLHTGIRKEEAVFSIKALIILHLNSSTSDLGKL